MDPAIAIPVGAVVGVVLGLLGAGGSLLTVPALIFLLGLPASEATGTSLVAVALMAVAGLVVHRRAGRCSCREGMVFGLAAAVTAAAAGWLSHGLGDRLLTAAFVVLLVGTAIWLVRRGDEVAATPGGEPATGRAALAGGGVGVLTGVLGVGGGFLIVPALVATRDLSMPRAVGTSQLIILISALGGIAGRFAGGTIQWGLGLLFGLGGLAGATLGSRLADRVPGRVLRLAFAAVAAAVAVLMAWQVVAGGTQVA